MRLATLVSAGALAVMACADNGTIGLSHGAASSAGVGAAAGSTGQGGAASASTGAGGAGSGGAGGSCAPDPDPCGSTATVCGTVDNGCGVQVSCGACPPPQPCINGQCCQPKTCSDPAPGLCGAQPDGCNQIIQCSTACGDDAWMDCGSDGHCQCTDAAGFPGYAEAKTICEGLTWGNTPMYCGDPTPENKADAPVDCHGAGMQGPGPGYLWCCKP